MMVVLQMQRDVCFKPVSAPRNRGRLDTLNAEIIMDNKSSFLIANSSYNLASETSPAFSLDGC